MTECPDCGTRLFADGRYYSLKDLAVFLRVSEVKDVYSQCHLSGSSRYPATCHGIRRRKAETIASDLGVHPSAIWPEVIEHDFEDASKPCAECGERFIPRRKSHKYCTPGCGSRRQSREWARAKYRSDPEWRARDLAKSRRYREEAARGMAVTRRKYQEQNRDQILAANREYKARNRDRIRAQNAAYVKANRERINAYKRAKYAEQKGQAA